MTEKKIFEFGEGGVLVYGSWIDRYVVLTKIKPPLGYVGKLKENDLEDKEELYNVKIEGELLKVIKNDLLNVKEKSVFNYGDFVLDFSDYNEQSVSIVLKAINEAIRGCSQLALAC